MVNRIFSGPGASCFVIAEAGVNHDGDLATAHRLVDVAKQVGADAVKFQTFAADRLVTRDAPKAAYQNAAGGAGESQWEMLRRLELSEEAHQELAAHCRDVGICFLSTPFDEAAADLLDRIGVEAFKTPSGELTNLPFLAHVARKGKPMIVSTGMSSLGEVEDAVRAVTLAAPVRLCLLHCVSAYPAPPAAANLRALASLAACFGVPTGYSDHTPGISVAIAAAALGARVIEKHLTLDRSLPGPDHQASLEPAAFAEMVSGIREAVDALGDGIKRPQAVEADVKAVARKSLVTATAMRQGTVVAAGHLAIRRPGTGLPPAMLDWVVGRRLRADLPAGHLISWSDLD
ncbi:MAG: N-acetylneuraminate synthase [Pseudomonadota bacterium]